MTDRVDSVRSIMSNPEDVELPDGMAVEQGPEDEESCPEDYAPPRRP